MRLISDFKDYYDCMAKYDEERTTLFIRKKAKQNVVVNVPSPRLPHFTNAYVTPMVTWFCGKIYLQAQMDFRFVRTPRLILLNPEVIKKRYQDHPRRAMVDTVLHAWNVETSTDLEALAGTYGPVFTVWLKDRAAELDPSPVLSKLGFAKLIPPHLAWNALRNWHQNKAYPGRPIPEMPNDIKIEQHGFDPKWSFRRRSTRKEVK